MNWKVTEEPSQEPVTLAEVKAQIRSDTGTEDELITGYIEGARRFVENRLDLALIDQEITYKLDSFPYIDRLVLPRTNLISVTSVSYVDQDGATQTLATSVYGVDTFSTPGAIYLKTNKEWPTELLNERNVVTVVYRAGWDDRASVPRNIKQAVLLLIGHWNENRETVLTGSIQTEIDFTVTALLNQERLFGL